MDRGSVTTACGSATEALIADTFDCNVWQTDLIEMSSNGETLTKQPCHLVTTPLVKSYLSITACLLPHSSCLECFIYEHVLEILVRSYGETTLLETEFPA